MNIMFTDSFVETTVETISKGEPEEQSANMGLIAVLVATAILALAALAYFSGFVGIEIEDEEEYQKTPVEIPEGYGDEKIEQASTLEKYDDHPGWLWDPSSEEWVPDPSYQE